MMLIDKEKLKQLKKDIENDDRPLFVDDVLKQPEKWATWDDLIFCCENTGIFDVNYFNKVNSKYEDVSTVKLLSNRQNEIHRATGGDNNVSMSEGGNNPIRVLDAIDLLETNHSIIVTNFEQQNANVKQFIQTLIRLFYLDLDGHGIWPAKISSHSGHAHLYAGKKESNSFPPHVDGPCNFIFQIYGENEFTIYENKKSSLTNLHMNYNLSKEEKKQIYDNLRPIETRVMKPGDMVYVPSRQYHYVRPLSDRLSLSFPFILKGPTSVML